MLFGARTSRCSQPYPGNGQVDLISSEHRYSLVDRNSDRRWRVVSSGTCWIFASTKRTTRRKSQETSQSATSRNSAIILLCFDIISGELLFASHVKLEPRGWIVGVISCSLSISRVDVSDVPSGWERAHSQYSRDGTCMQNDDSHMKYTWKLYE